MQMPGLLKAALGFCLCLVTPGPLKAAMYNFQQYYGNGVGGAVGNATLQLSNNTTTVKGNFIKGIGSFRDNLVIFVDSMPGGFTTTSVFSDHATSMETAVSG